MTLGRDDELVWLLAIAHCQQPLSAMALGSSLRVSEVPRVPPTSGVAFCLIAPSRREALSSAWRTKAVRLAVERLRPDGVVYAVAPPAARALLCRELVRAGFSVRQVRLHVPALKGARWVVPLEHGWSRAAGHVLGRGSRRRRLLVRLLELRLAERALREMLPNAAVVLSRRMPPATPSWLRNGDLHTTADLRSTLEVSWRGPQAGAVLLTWIRHAGEPSAAGKVAFGSSERLVNEQQALRSLGSHARRAGASVPEAGRLHRLGGACSLVQTPVYGLPVVRLLRGDHHRLESFLVELGRWLACWNGLTARSEVLTPEQLDRLLIEPVVALEPLLEGGAGYRRRMSALAQEARGSSVPFVAVHNDLTTANVLWSGATGLGVVDWEKAGWGLPLTDFSYAAVDAVHVARRIPRPAAFTACYGAPGGLRETVSSIQWHVVRQLDLTPAAATVALHACFAHHALNEHRAAETADRPFLATVQKLARTDLGAEWR